MRHTVGRHLVAITDRVINAGVSGDTSTEAVRRLDDALVQSRGIAVLLCGMEAPPIKGFAYSIEFHRVFRRLAERYKVTLVPFFLIGIVGDPDLTLGDFAHPNAEGHKLIAEALWPYLEPMLAK